VPLEADIADSSSAAPMFSALEEHFGPVLVLVNNAGIRADGLSPQLSDEDWRGVIDTNLSGAFWTTRRALGPMLRARFGRIVNVASVVGPRANAGQSNYAASKAGLIGFTKTVATEVARRGVTVNAVAPGFVETDFTADVPADAVSKVPARRAGTPEEVAACVRFLAGESASYVTGTTLTVDGGMSA
jgi:3-oxoacyl-[acyl-carrier protein] reductase